MVTAQGLARQVGDDVEVSRAVRRRQQHPPGWQDAGELGDGPGRFGDVVEHVVGHHDVEGGVGERQVLCVHVRAPTSSIPSSGSTADVAATTMPSERSLRVRRSGGSSAAMLTQSAPDPQPTWSTSPSAGHSTWQASHGYQGSSAREYLACSAIRAFRFEGSRYWRWRR